MYSSLSSHDDNYLAEIIRTIRDVLAYDPTAEPEVKIAAMIEGGAHVAALVFTLAADRPMMTMVVLRVAAHLVQRHMSQHDIDIVDAAMPDVLGRLDALIANSAN